MTPLVSLWQHAGRDRWKRWSLQAQLTVVVVVLVGMLLTILGVFLDLRISSYLLASSAGGLHAVADPIISRELSHPPGKPGGAPPATVLQGDSFDLARLAGALAGELDGPDSFAVVTTTDGTIVPGPVPPGRTTISQPSLPPIPRSTLDRAIAAPRTESAIVQDSRGRWLLLVIPLETGQHAVVGSVVLGKSLAAGDALLATLRLSFLVGALAGALLVGYAARGLVALALAPLGELVRASRHVAAGDWSVRVGHEMPPNEIGQVGHAFDAMVEQLEHAFEAQRRFIADASHELRTPLTALSGMVEMLEIGADGGDRATQQRIQQALTREVDRMSRLVTEMLALSRLDGGDSLTDVLRVDVLLADLRPSLEALAAGHDFQIDLAPTLPLRGNHDQLSQVVVNLVENAAKYTPAGGRIQVSVESTSAEVILRVADTGVGIPAVAMPRLFERFYRADASRARASGGFGLGLAISQAIVTAHGGTIEVASTVGQGSTFSVHLPVAPSVAPSLPHTDAPKSLSPL
jgi:two-component system OmpR family sensor kinase